MAATPNDIARVWDILENNSVGMLTTQFSGGLRARPLDARPDREAGAIFFVTDVRGHKDDEIAARPDVCFVVTVPSDNVYLSITGRASVTRDPAKAAANLEEDRRRLVAGRAGRPQRPRADDRAGHGRALGRPGKSLVAAFEFAKARMTGEKPNLGENRKKTVAMG